MSTTPTTNGKYSPAGMKLGKGNTAGRSNGGLVGTRMKDPRVTGGSLAEFGRACDRMLAEHVPGYRVRNFSGQDVTEEVLAKAPKRRGGRDRGRPVTIIFWKSKLRPVG